MLLVERLRLFFFFKVPCIAHRGVYVHETFVKVMLNPCSDYVDAICVHYCGSELRMWRLLICPVLCFLLGSKVIT